MKCSQTIGIISDSITTSLRGDMIRGALDAARERGHYASGTPSDHHPTIGAERLSRIEGDTGYPPLPEEIRSEEALVSVARAVREVHAREGHAAGYFAGAAFVAELRAYLAWLVPARPRAAVPGFRLSRHCLATSS